MYNLDFDSIGFLPDRNSCCTGQIQAPLRCDLGPQLIPMTWRGVS
jgi:hypothetical protein